VLSFSLILSLDWQWKARSDSGFGSDPAGRASPPVYHLGLVDLEAVILNGGEARCSADGAVHVAHDAALPTDHVVVVVSHTPFIQRR